MQSPSHCLTHRLHTPAWLSVLTASLVATAHLRWLGYKALLCSAVVLAATALTGCVTADIPQGAVHPETSQKRVRAVHHWDVLAHDVAGQVAAKVAHWPADQHPIFVEVQGQSGFEKGFRQLLMTQLVDKGVNLSTTPVPVTLNVAVQVVQHPSGADPHSAARWLVAHDVAVARGLAVAGANLDANANVDVNVTAAVNPPPSGAMASVAGAAPIAGAAPVSQSMVTPVQVMPLPLSSKPAAAGMPSTEMSPPAHTMHPATSAAKMPNPIYGDPKAWIGPEMSSDGRVYTEVLVTTSLESGGRYLARSSDIYYIGAQDAVLYGVPVLPPAPPPVKGKTWQVVAP